MDEMIASVLENKDDICRFYTDNFRLMRKKLGMRQCEIAEMLGTSQRRISEIENGKAKVSWTLMMALSAVFVLFVNKENANELEALMKEWEGGKGLTNFSAAYKRNNPIKL